MSTNETNPLDMPAMAPPEGIIPNYENPPNQTAMGRAILSVAVVLSTLAVVFRLYTTFFVLRKAFVGDFVFVLGFALFLTAVAFVFETAENPGLFIHQYELLFCGLIPFLKNSFLAGLIFGPALALLKSAILLEWLRIFAPPGMRNMTFWSCHILLWGNLVFYGLCIILLCVQCTPLEFVWNPLIAGGGHCTIKMTWTELASSLVNLITDVFIMVIPQRAIWKLNMSRERKLAVAGVFAIGLLGIIATAIRVSFTVYVTTDTDYSFVFSRVMICGIAEGTCAIIVMSGTTASRGFAALASSRLASSLRRTLLSGSKTGNNKSSGTSGVQSSGPHHHHHHHHHGHHSGGSTPNSHDKWPAPSKIMVTAVSSAKNKKDHGYTELEDENPLVPLGNMPPSSGIIRSTGFHTSEEYTVNRPPGDYAPQYQYPWVETKRSS